MSHCCSSQQTCQHGDESLLAFMHDMRRTADDQDLNWCLAPAETFAKEATAALHEAAEQLPAAALEQVNGKQLKKLKRQQCAAGMAGDKPAAASLSQQRHEAQLAGAVEAVPLKLKSAKLAQQQQQQQLPPAGLQDMDAALQQSSVERPAKKQKKKSRSSPATASSGQKPSSGADGLAMPSTHADSANAAAATGSQKKKRVRFSMKRNLLMQIGGAVPPEEIRTPPDSRPKV